MSKDSNHKRPWDFTLSTAFWASAALGAIGGIMRMSESNNIKLAAVWMLVSGVIVAAIVFGIRQTIELSNVKPRFTESPAEYTVFFGEGKMTFRADTLQSSQSIFGVTGAGEPFSAHVLKKELLVDADIYAGKGRPPIQLRDNDIMGRPPGWDMQQDKSAVEIVNDQGNPVFQLEYVSGDTARLKGVFVAGPIIFVVDDSGGVLQTTVAAVQTSPVRYSLAPIFKYPSKKFRGKRSTVRKSAALENPDATLTTPSISDIAQRNIQALRTSSPLPDMNALVGTTVKWRVVFAKQMKDAGEDTLVFKPNEREVMPGVIIPLTPALVPISKELITGWPYTVEGTVSRVMGSANNAVILDTTSITPIGLKNVQVIQ
jgi:hypothetical protein